MHYSKVAIAKELETRKDRMIFRFFEMIPGIATWGTFALLFFFSWRSPIWVAFFIIGFDLYWFFRTIYFSFYAWVGYRKMKEAMAKDWLHELDSLPLGEYSIPLSSWRELYHLIIIPMVNESYEIVRGTFEALKNADYPKEQMIVVLALEERVGKEAFEVGEKIESECSHAFGYFFVTRHPADMKGEIAGKGSNETWAARAIKKNYIDPHSISYEHIIVSTFDVDTAVAPQYFSRLSYVFLTTPNPLHTSFQPVSLFTNNIWDAPSVSRLLAFSTTFWQALNQERKDKLVTFSSHSMSFKALYDIDFWQTNVVSEDSRIFWQCFLHYNGDYKVEPLYYPVYMDANLASTFWDTMKNIYKQQLRWAYGVGDTAYLLFGFLKNKKIPLRKKFTGDFSHSKDTIPGQQMPSLFLCLDGSRFSSGEKSFAGHSLRIIFRAWLSTL
jgi:cellulose synthase/poly-beta-1,6-N-acetylglucosamine synthase-like glycosyltransferase